MNRMRALVDELAGRQAAILDVGCGGGYDLSRWRAFGWPEARLAGVDLVEQRVELARAEAPGVDIRLGQGATLPFDDAAFDVATAVTVFSSILDASQRISLFQEMMRVVRPSGFVLVYDFVVRNPRNASVIAMPLRRLKEIGGPWAGSMPLTPLLHAVAVGALVHPTLARVAVRLAPRTHRLTWWRRDDTGMGSATG